MRSFLYNSIVQHGRSGRPDRFEAECTKCDFKYFAMLDSSDPKGILLSGMKKHVENTGHVMVQIGLVVVPIPKDQKVVRRII